MAPTWTWISTFISIIATYLLLPPATATPPTTCNGHPEYCSRKYSNITQIGAHDSPFIGPLPQQNQNIDITHQLDLGIRFLQAQTHKSPHNPDILELCHTSCLLEDAGSLESYLRTVKGWLDGNADEVVTLLLTNPDSVDLGVFDRAFEGSGAKEYVFVPPGGVLGIEEWPTLGGMIEGGSRLVVFLDYGASPLTTPSYPYILDEFAYFFETPFDVTDPSFNDCSVNRPASASPAGRMYIVNHFLDVDVLGVLIPDRINAARTNAVSGFGSIGAQCDLCLGIYGRVPNFVLVDFVDKGQVVEAQERLNGV